MTTKAGTRVAVTAALGLAGGVIASLLTIWQAAVLIGWDVALTALLGAIWWAVHGLSAADTKKNAAREDPASASPKCSSSPPGWPSWVQWACS